ncbi:beta-hexosaminidase 3 isoform X1 [Setaria italica]|uniref:beta-hexosaminidase 3 isoform X1 n=1 Tax=Setaria italica TaxID=4555 RepID=UPI000BE4B6A2|nr:beta-hexosaminidase 3 isoform X1 [Setaria italica]
MEPALRLLLVLMVFMPCTGDVNVWPMPKSVSNGKQTVFISKDLKMTVVGSNYSDEKAILRDAFGRMVAVVEQDHVISESYERSPVLVGMNVVVRSRDDEVLAVLLLMGTRTPVNFVLCVLILKIGLLQLNFGVDESYSLFVPSTGHPLYAQIEAQTVFGALHALETFSQLCSFDLESRQIILRSAPWSILDSPRFPYRGLLIDTSRHYLPVPVIKRVIDSMTYSKLNVLHWHVVDEQSFPIEIPSYPKLWNGAYSYSERYTKDDAIDIVQYAEKRGVNVLAEIDVPGHALSWGVGYPSLWPSAICKEPLDVSNNFTFEVIDGILQDFSKIFKFKFIHLGGDEVNTSCWTTTPRIKEWLILNGMDETDAYRYFVLRAQKIARSYGYDIINWEEPFNNFGDKLDRNTVVHNWLGGTVAEKAVAAGLRCILSKQESWYLDHLDAPWEGFYMNEPLANIYKPEQQRLILGGEVCMWGEQVDASDIQQTIWPRAAAAAERLWTPIEKIATNTSMVAPRLARFRCLLNQRGVAAAPLVGYGRSAPSDPGSCISQ